ncbi:MAG: CoA ester lyase [gamma proteobacterium symbiont of Ctena orbiculata]|nr:MAG: CoA ester lyase [gamma proteobacterium symbiont of Ctena orbiculata]PVV18393.1 MAG: CoA ester lyase [gamma proteobacterium symbiont of Ctena orbiculata]
MAYKNRLHRSELAVPGSNMRMIEKAPHAGADLVFLDLEDAVAVSDKDDARRNVIHALNDLDWSKCSVSVRINGLDSHFCYRDIVDVVEQAGDKLDTILVPKVGHPSDLQFVALMLGQIEAAKGFKPINLHALIETALGMANVEAIAQSCPDRLEALVFGVADYAASTQARTISMGGVNPDYHVLSDPNDEGQRKTYLGNQWHFAMSRLIVACRAYGLRPIDGPFGDISDPDGYLAVAKSFAALGGEGKWAIHPSQIDLANQIFSPAEEEVEHARRVLDAMEKAAAEGMGAVSLDGRMIDAASIRQAEVVIEKMKQIESTATLKEAVA